MYAYFACRLGRCGDGTEYEYGKAERNCCRFARAVLTGEIEWQPQTCIPYVIGAPGIFSVDVEPPQNLIDDRVRVLRRCGDRTQARCSPANN